MGALDYDAPGWLYAYDRKTGKQVWRADAGPAGSGSMSPIVAGGRIIAGVHDPTGSRIVSFGTP